MKAFMSLLFVIFAGIATAQRRVRELTGKSIPDVVDDASIMMESMIKDMK
jgi:hypothetical protein